MRPCGKFPPELFLLRCRHLSNSRCSCFRDPIRKGIISAFSSSRSLLRFPRLQHPATVPPKVLLMGFPALDPSACHRARVARIIAHDCYWQDLALRALPATRAFLGLGVILQPKQAIELRPAVRVEATKRVKRHNCSPGLLLFNSGGFGRRLRFRGFDLRSSGFCLNFQLQLLRFQLKRCLR